MQKKHISPALRLFVVLVNFATGCSIFKIRPIVNPIFILTSYFGRINRSSAHRFRVILISTGRRTDEVMASDKVIQFSLIAITPPPHYPCVSNGTAKWIYPDCRVQNVEFNLRANDIFFFVSVLLHLLCFVCGCRLILYVLVCMREWFFFSTVYVCVDILVYFFPFFYSFLYIYI